MRVTVLRAAIATATVAVTLSGCASIEDRQSLKTRGDVNHDVRRFASEQRDMLTRNPVVQDIDGLYLGSGRMVNIDQSQHLPAGIDQHISLYDSSAMSLEAVAERIQSVTGIPVRISGQVIDQGGSGGMSQFGSGGGGRTADEMLQQVLSAGAPAPSGRIRLQHDGSLSSLLNLMASRFNVFWEYRGGAIRFSTRKVKHYQVALLAGSVNQSADISNTTGGGGGTGEQQSYVQANGGLSASFRSSIQPWDSVEDLMDELVADGGSYSINEATSSIIVSGSPTVHENVEAFIESYNDVLMRQVALNVSVFTLQLNDSFSAGFNLDGVLESVGNSYGLGITGPTLGSGGGEMGEFTATLFEGANSPYAGSELLVRALDQWGETSIVTSSSGVVLNGQPFPIQDVSRVTYLASTELDTSGEAGSSVSLTPGTVTTGFSMQVVPQILEDQELLLQYAFTLSNLKDLVELSSGGQTIQGPEVDDRSFTQRSRMPLGSTLVIAGFQRDEDSVSRSTGGTGWNRNSNKGKTIVFVTITANEA